ncbi:MAG: hypothetical protein EBU66_20255 [Bacteroidetes bacterium]|nr:hypothetical protein [Bacteroidota bacterium]
MKHMHTSFRNRTSLLLSLGTVILMTMIGCKSPTDLDTGVIEVPMPTNPVSMSDMTFEFIGGGTTSKNIPNAPQDYGVFSFVKHSIERIHIDTTSKTHVKCTFSFNGMTDVTDRSQNEEVLPYEMEIECDTMLIPILDSIPVGRAYKIPVQLHKARVKAYIFSKRKEANGYRIIRTDRDFDFLDDMSYNSCAMDVYAVRAKKPAKGISIIVESRFNVVSAEIESFDKKMRSPFGGRFLFKVTF